MVHRQFDGIESVAEFEEAREAMERVKELNE